MNADKKDLLRLLAEKCFNAMSAMEALERDVRKARRVLIDAEAELLKAIDETPDFDANALIRLPDGRRFVELHDEYWERPHGSRLQFKVTAF